MNDASEVTYGHKLLSFAIGRATENRAQDEKDFGNAVLQRVVEGSTSDRPMIFCLSERPNLLNQWRDYGRDVVPYCMELDTKSLLDATWNFQTALVKMIYDQVTQERLLETLVGQIYQVVLTRRNELNDPEAYEAILSAIAGELMFVLIHFKNPAFVAEEEWRLLTFGIWVSGQRIGFRTSALGVVPYVERVPIQVDGLLPIGDVWVGPSPHGPTAVQALEIFLRVKGYSGRAFYSTIPSR